MIRRIRNLNPKWDAERIINLFGKLKVSAENHIAKTGFYEYPLSEEQIVRRMTASPELSLVLEDNHGNLLAYLLAYQTRDINTRGLTQGQNDPVLQKLRGANPRLVYVDQLCARQGVPLFVIGRLVDIWTNIVYGETFDGRKLEGVVCAIPSKPWINVSSRRLAIARGYSRVGQVEEGQITLDIYAKPNLEKDAVFDSRTDFLGTRF